MSAQRGNQRENDVRHHLESQGWLVGSLRHIKGAGDLLAVHRAYRTRIVEVKSSARSPWNDFGRTDRRALRKLAESFDADPLLAYWPYDRKGLRWLVEDDWPTS